MNRKMLHSNDHQIFDPPPSPISIMTEIGIDEKMARAALHAMVKAGYYIAPRNPSNAMLVAYMEAMAPHVTKNIRTMMVNVGKAKLRWKAMGESGTRLALSPKIEDRRNQPAVE